MGNDQAESRDKIDLIALLEEPLEILQDGKSTQMDATEAAIRQQVAKALQKRNLTAILAVIDLAAKHDLIAVPKAQNNLIVIPKTVSEAHQKLIFSYPGPSIETIKEYLTAYTESVEQIKAKLRADGLLPPEPVPTCPPPNVLDEGDLSATVRRVLMEEHLADPEGRGPRKFTVIGLTVKLLQLLAAAGDPRAYKSLIALHRKNKPSSSKPLTYLVVPERLTEEEWVERYSPKERPPLPLNDE